VYRIRFQRLVLIFIFNIKMAGCPATYLTFYDFDGIDHIALFDLV
jgi:hypothetical protein